MTTNSISAILYLFSLKHSTKKPASIFGIVTIVCLTRINHKTRIVKSVREGVFEFHIALQDFSRCFRRVSPKYVILSYFRWQVRLSTPKKTEPSTFESFTYSEVTSYWINDIILYKMSLLPREITTAQAIFWDTSSIVVNNISSAGGQGGRKKKKGPLRKSNFQKIVSGITHSWVPATRDVPHMILCLKCNWTPKRRWTQAGEIYMATDLLILLLSGVQVWFKMCWAGLHIK